MYLWKIIIISLFIALTVSCNSQTEKVEKQNNEITKTGELSNLEGDNLVHAVFQSIAREIWVDKKVDMDYFSKLPIQKRIIYKTYLLEMEVNNGGFSQFYSNRGYELAEDIPQFMELIGATNHGKIVTDANKYFINNKIDSLDENPFNKLDERFYKESNDKKILKLQANYIKKNLRYFDNE